MSNIIMLQLTREEAAAGTYRTINTATGPTMIHIPPVQDGMVIRVPTANGEEVYARIQIVGSQPGAPTAGKSKAPVIVLVSVAAVVAIAVTLSLTLGQHHGGGGVTLPTVNPIASTDLTTPTPDDTYTPAPSYTYEPPTTDPTTPSESPFTEGSCLSGTLPDSTTAQPVTDVAVVDCSASNAHYKIIHTFPFTDDLHQCDSISQTQYEFSETRTWGGATLMSTVYCVVGLGSYARS